MPCLPLSLPLKLDPPSLPPSLPWQEEENDAAVELLPAVLAKVDAVEDINDRLELLLKGVLAGNIFDLGAQSVSVRACRA